MIYSANQHAIFNHDSLISNLLVNAVAGSGKTTTIVQLANLLATNGAFLAFNKSIATELSTRLPKNFPASTFHSLGLNLLRGNIPKYKVDQYKLANIIKFDPMVIKATTKYGQPDLPKLIKDVVSRAKGSGIGVFCDVDDEQAWLETINDADIDIPEEISEGEFIDLCVNVLEDSNITLNIIDFEDMLYVPLLLNNKNKLRYQKYPILIIDEAQDTNRVQLELIKMLTDRIVAVGDKNQSIYAFRGSDHTAMDNFRRAFKCHELPLDVSYRCATVIIAEAQKIVPHIKAKEGAIEGSVTRLKLDDFISNAPTLNHLDAIICRLNAPIFELCLFFIKNNLPFTCYSDFAAGLLASVKAVKANNLESFKLQIKAEHDKKILKYTTTNQQNRIAAENDRYDTILNVANNSTSVDDLINTFEKILNSTGGPVLCTIHKSKGKEWDNVYFFMQHLCPPKWVVEKGNHLALQQEQNLRYVAITRAKNNLIYAG